MSRSRCQGADAKEQVNWQRQEQDGLIDREEKMDERLDYTKNAFLFRRQIQNTRQTVATNKAQSTATTVKRQKGKLWFLFLPTAFTYLHRFSMCPWSQPGPDTPTQPRNIKTRKEGKDRDKDKRQGKKQGKKAFCLLFRTQLQTMKINIRGTKNE